MKKIFAFIFALSIFLPSFAFARNAEEITDWYIKNFESEIMVNTDSSLQITEKITADCGNLPDKHGIFRILPTFYKMDDGKKVKTPVELESITDFSGNSIPYETIKNSETITWKIGDKNKTVTGENNYKIAYSVKNAIRFSNDKFDEFYWNLTGSFWEIPIDHFTATIKFPAEITEDNTSLSVYSGTSGEKTNYYADYSWKDKSTLVFESKEILNTGLAITASVTFPKNIITPYKPSFFEAYGVYLWLLIPLLTFIFLYRYWSKYGRDPKINSAIAPEFEIPEKLSPIDMGMLYSNMNFLGSYLTASIINLAVKGYIKIEEIAKKTIFSAKDYKLTKLKEESPKDLSDSENCLLDELFSGKQNEVNISDLRFKFVQSLEVIKKSSTNFLETKKYFDKGIAARKVIIGIFLFVFGALAFAGMGFFGFWGFASLLASAIICGIFMLLITKRTEKGAMLEHRVKGFKMYMEKAETFRQQFNEKENIFEKLLPYAIMFGLTKKWIAAFKKIYGEKYFAHYHPVWFYGSIGSFNADSFESSISSMSSAMVASMTPSSSGSGGGGFSGGGGGGGGGGGW